MKAPSKNITKSLKGQNPMANAADGIEVQEQRSGGPTMTVPGDGLVPSAPGKARHADRSAANYTGPMSRYGGSGGE